MTTIAFDTETRGLDWFDGQTAFLASYATDEGAVAIARETDPYEIKFFLAQLRSADVLVCHNLSFDSHQVRATWGLDVVELPDVELHDTDLMSRVLHPEGQRKGARGGHGLKNLAKVWLGYENDSEEAIKELAKSIGLRTLKKAGAYYEVWKAYPNEMEDYARDDARWTLELFEVFKEQLDDPRNAKLKWIYDLEMRVARPIVRSERLGVKLDPVAVKKLRSRYRRAKNKADRELREEWPEVVLEGPGSSASLREHLLGSGVPLYKRTAKTGELAVDKFALQEFEDDYPIIHSLSEWKRATNFLSTYVDPMEGREIVHHSTQQLEAWTGRMSSRRPNMQNLPKRGEAGGASAKLARSPIIPRPKHALVAIDYEGIEFRLLAYYLGDQGLRDRIRAGWDPHPWIASLIYNESVAPGSRLPGFIYSNDERAFQKGTKGEPQREIAKNTTYAITYGAGKNRVSLMNKVPMEEAGRIISAVKDGLPGFWRLNGRIRKKIATHGYVETYFGRKQVVGKDKSYVGMSALIQGTGADIMKIGFVQAEEVVRELGATPLLVVHDELVIEAPIKKAAAVAKLAERAMIDAAPDLDPPLAVETKIVTTSFADA